MAERSFALNVLKHIGVIRGGPASSSLVPRADNAAALQREYGDFLKAGEVADVNSWSRYAGLMRRPTTFEEMLRLWEEMSGWDLMAAALSEIVEESLQTDPSAPGLIWYRCNKPEFEEDLNEMLSEVNAEELLPSQIWNVASLGNHFEKVDYAPRKGVMGLTYAPVFDVRRYWLEKNRQCVGFRWIGHEPPQRDNVFTGVDGKTPIERVALKSGQNLENLWYPWDFVHFRRMFRLRESEHGEPLFDEAQGIYKKLRLAVDQMVVHRAQVQPDRYAINIDVKNQPPMEQLRTVQRWRQQLRSKIAFGQGSSADVLSNPTDFKSFYSAMALDTILYIAKPEGFQHTIEKLQGTANVPDIYDIELLINLFFSIIGMPKWWVMGNDGQQPASGKALLATDIRFLRKIKALRRTIMQGYRWLGYFHAALLGKDVSDLNIEVEMPAVGGLEDQMKLEVINLQADVLDKLGDVMDKFNLPREAWVEVIFKRFMHLPDDMVSVFMTALPPEAGGLQDSLQEEERRRLPSISETQMGVEVERAFNNDIMLRGRMAKLREVIHSDGLIGKYSERGAQKLSKVFVVPSVGSGDVIVSSWGNLALKATLESGERVTRISIDENVATPRGTKDKTVVAEAEDAAAKPTGPGTIPTPARKFIGASSS